MNEQDWQVMIDGSAGGSAILRKRRFADGVAQLRRFTFRKCIESGLLQLVEKLDSVLVDVGEMLLGIGVPKIVTLAPLSIGAVCVCVAVMAMRSGLTLPAKRRASSRGCRLGCRERRQ